MSFRRTFRWQGGLPRPTSRSAPAVNVKQHDAGFCGSMIGLTGQNPSCSSLYDTQHGRIMRIYSVSAIVKSVR
jgi:hypothetical protein